MVLLSQTSPKCKGDVRGSQSPLTPLPSAPALWVLTLKTHLGCPKAEGQAVFSTKPQLHRLWTVSWAAWGHYLPSPSRRPCQEHMSYTGSPGGMCRPSGVMDNPVFPLFKDDTALQQDQERPS